MNPVADQVVDPIEALIALFKASPIWGDYCVVAEISDCLDSAEVVLRERWIQQWPYQRLFASWEDDRSRRLSRLEQTFLSETFPQLVKSGRVITKHRILAKHHPTTGHYSTPPEMFENAGICIDRSEILMQLSRGPCLKLVEIRASGMLKSDDKTIVQNYVKAERAAGREPTQRGCERVTNLKRHRVIKAWPLDVSVPKQGRRRKDSSTIGL